MFVWELGAVTIKRLVVLMKTPADIFPSAVVPHQKLLWACKNFHVTLLYNTKNEFQGTSVPPRHAINTFHLTITVQLPACSAQQSPAGCHPWPGHDFFIIEGYASVEKVHWQTGLHYTIVHFWSHEQSCMTADRRHSNAVLFIPNKIWWLDLWMSQSEMLNIAVYADDLFVVVVVFFKEI